MSINWTEMQEALADAKRTVRSADTIISQAAEMIIGRLKSGNVSGYTLEALKRELRSYNIHTNSWMEK
jgi:hypothetical protein